jgi:hypothetical protein
MTLVAGRLMPSFDGSIKPITFDAFDALCDEFITDERFHYVRIELWVVPISHALSSTTILS